MFASCKACATLSTRSPLRLASRIAQSNELVAILESAALIDGATSVKYPALLIALSISNAMTGSSSTMRMRSLIGSLHDLPVSFCQDMIHRRACLPVDTNTTNLEFH